MKKLIIPSVLLMALLLACFGAVDIACGQELSSEQRSSIKKISRAVDKSGSFFKEKNYAKSAGQIREALRLMDRLRGEGDVIAEKLKKDYERIAKAQTLLTSKGQSFDPLPAFDEMFESSDVDGEARAEGSASKNSGSGKVSFVNQVAPILVQHCGQCHIDQSLGRYSVASYEALRKKSRKGVVVKPKDTAASRLILLVESGQMPKKKPQLPDEQIQILKDWIDQGAKFDGSSRAKKESLKSFVSQTEGSDSRGSGSKGSNRR